jgi:toxin ParE1/3/4
MPSSRSLDFSPEAEDDVRGILAYSLTEWGEAQRDVYAAALDAAFQRLIDFPEIGRSRPEFFPGCRTLPVERHIIYYRLDETTIRIVRVLHMKMDAARHLGR